MAAGLWHEEAAQVGVAAQYAAIAPGSAQTWLVRTTAMLNCEARRRDGWCAGRSGTWARDGHGDAVRARGARRPSLH